MLHYDVDALQALSEFVEFLKNPDKIKQDLADLKVYLEKYDKVLAVYPTVEQAEKVMAEARKQLAASEKQISAAKEEFDRQKEEYIKKQTAKDAELLEQANVLSNERNRLLELKLKQEQTIKEINEKLAALAKVQADLQMKEENLRKWEEENKKKADQIKQLLQ